MYLYKYFGLLAVGGWRVRYGTKFRHPGCPEYSTHAGVAGPLPTQFTGNKQYAFENKLILSRMRTVGTSLQ